jgi:hypothetical protein
MTVSDPTLKTESSLEAFKDIGSITVADIVDNPDGTCTIHFDVSEEFQTNLTKAMNWDTWSQEKFNALFLDALEKQLAKYKQEK